MPRKPLTLSPESLSPDPCLGCPGCAAVEDALVYVAAAARLQALTVPSPVLRQALQGVREELLMRARSDCGRLRLTAGAGRN